MPKFFTEKQIYSSTFFGGPIPAGILIYKNFKRLGDDKKATLTMILTFIFTSILFYGLMQLPDEIATKIPNIFYTTLYTLVVFVVYRNYLAKPINEKITDADHKASNLQVAGFTILGLVTSLIIIFAIAFYEPAFPGERLEYGSEKHEIFYDEGEISRHQLNTVGKVLTEFEYFNSDATQAIRIDKEANKYNLKLSINKELWENYEVIAVLNNLKETLSKRTGSEFKLTLIHYDFSGNTLTKEL